MPDPSIPTFGSGAAGSTVTAAGAGEIDQQGQRFDPKIMFYDPSKFGRVKGLRLVPGMQDDPFAIVGDPAAPTHFDTSTLGVPGQQVGESATYQSQVPATPVSPGQQQGYQSALKAHQDALLASDEGGPDPGNTPTMPTPYREPSGANTLTAGQAPGTTLASAMNNLLAAGQSADPTAIENLQRNLVKGGYLDPTKKGFNLGSISSTQDPTYTAYYQLLTSAIRTTTNWRAVLQNRVDRDAGKKYEDALRLQDEKAKTAQEVADRRAAAEARSLLPSQVNRSATNISDPLTAQGLLTPVLTNALGHAPSADDLAQFTKALQTAQAQSPTLTTGTASPLVDGGGDKTTTTTGGFDPSQFTANYVNQKFGKEAGNVNEGTDFYRAALQAITTSGGR